FRRPLFSGRRRDGRGARDHHRVTSMASFARELCIPPEVVRAHVAGFVAGLEDLARSVETLSDRELVVALDRAYGNFTWPVSSCIWADDGAELRRRVIRAI